MKIAAVVVTYNRKELLRKNLAALKGQTRPVDHVLVVNNASTDGTEKMLSTEFPEVEVLTLPENQGGAGGFHEGMKHAHAAGYDWLWLMDDDTFPRPGALAALLEGAALPEKPVILASRQLTPEGRPHPTAGFVNPTDWRRLAAWWRYRPRYRPVRWALFTSVLIRRDVIDRHGLPKKRFFIWEDDLEYTARVLKREWGFQARDSEVVHASASKPYVSATTGENRVFYGVRNRIWVLKSPALGPLGKAFLAAQMAFGLLGFLALHPRREALAEVRRAIRAGLKENP